MMLEKEYKLQKCVTHACSCAQWGAIIFALRFNVVLCWSLFGKKGPEKKGDVVMELECRFLCCLIWP